VIVSPDINCYKYNDSNGGDLFVLNWRDEEYEGNKE
jgi:hypothetical protein